MFVQGASASYSFDAGNVIALGFSNGANMAAAISLLQPEWLRAAILFCPSAPFAPERQAELAGKSFFVGAGRTDPIVLPQETEQLVALLGDAGAEVTVQWQPGGHLISDRQVEAAKGWLESCAMRGNMLGVDTKKVELSNEEIQRYSRHLIMPEVAMEGQRKLKAGAVLMIGAGGLGSPLGLYLAAAGVGHIGIVDFDVVDDSNLQRQIIHGTSWVGRPKLESARTRMLDLNPYIQVDAYPAPLSSANALRLFADYDVIVDGTDNFPTRYLVNDACVLTSKPNVYGSIYRFEGQASVFDAQRGPCYRCLYPEPPPPGLVPSCAEGGVLGVLPGVIGTIQATEAIKLIIGQGEPLIGRLLIYDALEMHFHELKLRKDPRCPVCGEHPTVTELIDYEAFCGIAPEESLGREWEITPQELEARLARDGKGMVILDVREPVEWGIVHLPNAKLIPRGDLPERIHELDTADEIVVYCKTGVRSAAALAFMHQAGFRKVKNLRGGIDAWARVIDASLPRY